MNQTLVDSTTYSKVKRLNLEIKELKEEKRRHGYLDNEQKLLLKLKEDKLEKLIQKL